VLLEQHGDIDGAADAYAQAAEHGDVGSALRLGQLLEEHGRLADAARAYRWAAQSGQGEFADRARGALRRISELVDAEPGPDEDSSPRPVWNRTRRASWDVSAVPPPVT
jgi:predicted TPR repeat methyltransferase